LLKLFNDCLVALLRIRNGGALAPRAGKGGQTTRRLDGQGHRRNKPATESPSISARFSVNHIPGVEPLAVSNTEKSLFVA
jgi:hypothetical protein